MKPAARTVQQELQLQMTCRYTARAEALTGSYVLARYDELKMSEDGAEPLREWFPIQHDGSGKPPILPVNSDIAVHSAPGYYARPAAPNQVRFIIIYS